MEEEQRGGFALFGGGFSALIGVGALVLALNNPTVPDLQAEAASLIQQEVANNSNPLLALMSQEIGRAGADALTISSTNYVVFTHFEVTTPDTRLLGGEAPQQLCFVGVMKRFYPCEAASEGARQSTSATSGSSPDRDGAQTIVSTKSDTQDADQPVQRGSLSPRDMQLIGSPPDESRDPSDLDLLRPRGWSCDGVRVKFDPETPWSKIRVEIAGQRSAWSMSVGTQGVVSVSNSVDPRFSGANFVFEPGSLAFNERLCVAVK